MTPFTIAIPSSKVPKSLINTTGGRIDEELSDVLELRTVFEEHPSNKPRSRKRPNALLNMISNLLIFDSVQTIPLT
jgi:hypothetical protein